MLYPLVGYFLGSLINIINYAFIDTLPLEFFYLNKISAFFGGYAVYFLGVFVYGTTVTKPEERAYRLARLDGMLTLSDIIGTMLSPYIFDYMGYYGNYVFSSASFALAIIHLVFFVKEPIDTKPQTPLTNNTTDKNLISKLKEFFFTAVIIPLKSMKEVVTKDRKSTVKFLITLQLLCYFLYLFTSQVNRLVYLYMLLVFDGFTGKDYAHLSVVMSLLRIVFLLFIMPVISGKLKVHDALLITIMLGIEVIGAIAKPFTTTLWQFYIAYGLGTIGYCKFGIIRSLLSKFIEPDEVGKVFSLLAIISAVGPMVGNPVFRQLYNYTISIYPGTMFLFFAALLFVAMSAAGFVYFKSSEIDQCQEQKNNNI
jgi:PCFT/HCP family folate transporter-like MFS transporter 1/3